MTTEQEAIKYSKLLGVLTEWNAENYQYVQSLVAMGNKVASNYVKDKGINVDAPFKQRGQMEKIQSLTTDILSEYVRYCEKENLNLETHAMPIVKTLGGDSNPKFPITGADAYSRSKCMKERTDMYSNMVDQELKELRTSAKTGEFTKLLEEIERLQNRLELDSMSLVMKVERSRDEGRL